MLQKIVNGIAIASGVVSLTVVGAAGYVFIRKDAIIDNIKSKVMESVLPGGLGTGALGGALEMPKLGGLGDLGGLGSAGSLGLPAPSNPVASPDATATPESPVPFGF